MAQQAQTQIGPAAVGIDNQAIGILSQRIDRQIAAQQILFQRDVRGGIAGKTGVAGTRLRSVRARAYSSRLFGCRNTEIAAYLLVARIKQLLRRGTHHDPISVFDR